MTETAQTAAHAPALKPVVAEALDQQLELIPFAEPSKNVVASFIERTSVSPQRLAAASASERLSYGQLDERANQIAHCLRSQGVNRGTVVGLLLTRSVSLAASALGVLKAGGAYLPLDPEIPAERLAYLLEDAGAAILITEAQLS